MMLQGELATVEAFAMELSGHADFAWPDPLLSWEVLSWRQTMRNAWGAHVRHQSEIAIEALEIERAAMRSEVRHQSEIVIHRQFLCAFT